MLLLLLLLLYHVGMLLLQLCVRLLVLEEDLGGAATAGDGRGMLHVVELEARGRDCRLHLERLSSHEVLLSKVDLLMLLMLLLVVLLLLLLQGVPDRHGIGVNLLGMLLLLLLLLLRLCRAHVVCPVECGMEALHHRRRLLMRLLLLTLVLLLLLLAQLGLRLLLNLRLSREVKRRAGHAFGLDPRIR